MRVVSVRFRTLNVRYRTYFSKLKNVLSLLINKLLVWHGFCSIINIEEKMRVIII